MDRVDSTVSSRPKVWTRILQVSRSEADEARGGVSHLGISAPLLETGEARLVLRGRGTGGGGQGNESDLPIPNFSPVLSRRLSLDLFPRLTRSSILFSLLRARLSSWFQLVI